MRLDFTSAAATAAIAMALSATLWWHFQYHHPTSSDADAVKKSIKPQDGINQERSRDRTTENAGRPKSSNDPSNAREKPVILTSIYSSSKMLEEQQNQEPKSVKQQKEKLQASKPKAADCNQQSGAKQPTTKPEMPQEDLEMLKKIKINDIPDFTIELDESDNDMF